MLIRYFIISLLTLLQAPAAALADANGIGWIPTWKQACEEASKNKKPILLIAAAPQCAGVPGIW